MLSLRQLKLFRAVAEAGSFTGAAARLYVTQSAVSHAVRELEEEAGTALFDRLPKGVRPTAAGRLLLAESAPLLAGCEALERRLPALERRAPLRLVSSITIASFWLPRILLRFERERPELPVSVTVVRAADALTALRTGEADLAFVEGALPEGEFCGTKFSEYTLCAVCAPDYPISRRPEFEELCGAKLLLREPGSAIRDTFQSALLLGGHAVRPSWESVNSTALLEAAKAGLGVTVLPELLVADALERGELRLLELPGPALANELFVVRRRDSELSPALELLLDCARSQKSGGGASEKHVSVQNLPSHPGIESLCRDEDG